MSKVYLVGAGPGDPGLITWKGRELLASADVVLFDHLAPESLLELTPTGCERIYVGKKRADHAISQEEISGLMIDRARKGLTVVRLKGGDPYLFGRGGEEVEALADAGLAFEVVPGVTSALGIGAYTGVPLTHRDHTSVVTFVTGHSVEQIDWDRVGRSETLVVFMGLVNLRAIIHEIVTRGRPATTPAMAVRWGTRPDQQSVQGTLADLADRVESAHMKPPATVIIGEVVGLRSKLNWYERLPLFGQTIVVTRAAGQASTFVAKLRALGANTCELPVISLVPPSNPAPLDRAIEQLTSYDWILFTSVNGVRYFLERLNASAHDLRDLPKRIAAIGPATRAAIEDLHLKVDLMPREFVAESVVAEFEKHKLSGARILLPRAAAARDILPVELARLGAHVDVVEAYRNVIPTEAAATAERIFAGKKPDWVTFTSSSTVKNFLAIAGPEAIRGVRIASIGPVTSDTLRMHNLQPEAEAREFTTDGLLQAIASRTTPKIPDSPSGSSPGSEILTP